MIASIFPVASVVWNCVQAIQTIIWKPFADDCWRRLMIPATRTIAIVLIEMRSIRTIVKLYMETSSDDWDDWDDWNQSQDALFHLDQSRIKMSDNVEFSNALFMEEVQMYECLCEKFNEQYKTSFFRLNILLTQNLCLLGTFLRFRLFRIAITIKKTLWVVPFDLPQPYCKELIWRQICFLHLEQKIILCSFMLFSYAWLWMIGTIIWRQGGTRTDKDRLNRFKFCLIDGTIADDRNNHMETRL